jgi:hypothetical protein
VLDAGIDLRNYNEMLRYESSMDELRAIALCIADSDPQQEIFEGIKSTDYLFVLIKYYCRLFAEDIFERGQVTDDKRDMLDSGLFTIKKALGITEDDIKHAHENQLYKNSGFWEMRRYLGLFVDIAEEVAINPPDVIVCAGISGCVIGEYLGIVLEKKFNLNIPVLHMVFSRREKEPVAGILSHYSTEVQLNRALLVEDAVIESRTSRVMIETLATISPAIKCSLFALEIEQNQVGGDVLSIMENVYTFEEF